MICIFTDRVAIGIVDEGDKLPEQALPAHTRLLAQVLRGQVVVLGKGIDLQGTFPVPFKEMAKTNSPSLVCFGISDRTFSMEFNFNHGVFSIVMVLVMLLFYFPQRRM